MKVFLISEQTKKKIAIKCGNDKYEHKIGHIENGYVTVEYLDIIPSTITQKGEVVL